MYSKARAFSRSFTLLALAASATFVVAQASQPTPKRPAVHAAEAAQARQLPTIAYQKYTLPNGLTVLTHEDHRLPLVAVDLWYHVGPLNERPGRTGFAHLFEHMMFEGSEHVGEKAHFKDVQAAGATDVNGTTNFDRTNYFETMPSNQLELALWLESDRMGFLMEGLDRKLLANQRDVVRNERRQREGLPYDVADEAVFHLLFPKNHPYYGEVIGSHADIESARIADVRAFHQQFYTPSNASIAVAGDFDPVKLKDLLTRYFGPIPRGPKVEPVHVITPPITAERRATITDTVQLPRLSVAWLTPPAFAPDAYSVDAAIFALGGAKASRLDRSLVIKSQVAQSVTCNTMELKLTGIASCDITAKPGVKLEDLEATFWKELATLQQDGPTAEEVKASKALALTSKITGLQRLGGFGGVADTLDRYNQYTGDPDFLPKDVAMTEAVTIASSKAAADKYLSKNSAVVVYCVPGKKILHDVPRSPDNTDANVKITNPYTPAFEKSQEWRKNKPTPGPMPTFHLPVPTEFTLNNGLKVLLVQEHALPLLTAELVSRAGSDNNKPATAGLATLVTEVMGDGTESRSLEKLAEDQESIGTHINTNAGMDYAGISMGVLRSHADEGMDLLADVALHPAFRTADIERRRKQRLVTISQETDNVIQMAMRVGPKLLFGDQPYGLSGNGTPETVKAITAEDISGFYKHRYGPNDSVLVLTGDVSRAEAEKLANEYFGKWTSQAEAAPQIPAAPETPPTHVVIVSKPGAPQTALFAIGNGVRENSPDSELLDVLDYTLGSAFASRINMNLREVHGYTYGAFSGFKGFRDGGAFFVGSLVRTDVTAPAAKEMMGEIRNFLVHPSTAEELAAAKEASIRSLPGRFETNSAIAYAIQSLFVYDRPLDYYSKLPARYQDITQADVARAAKQYLHPDHLIIVTAGDRAKIEPALKAAGLGPVEVRDISGNVVNTATQPSGK
ncbi:M16 family metallopeptidase [Acidipila rosea]|uniref:Zinc protease n=1 Tax=Acidipila rosea TaxID=768535 RepID=A0A4R1L390_9BACT|nr:pitrilysin family protein [Acidipila rosea]TCK72496.1 zinc protease [Acidipila rosea]